MEGLDGNALFNKSLIDSQREDETAQVGSFPLALLSLMCFTLGIRCMSHICSLATRHGFSLLATKDIVSNLHICVKSLRNCGSDVVAHIKQFVGTRIAFYPRPTDNAQLETGRRLWHFLVSDAALADLFVELGIWYDCQSQLLYVFTTDQDPDGLVGSGCGLGRVGDGSGRVGVDFVSSWVGSGQTRTPPHPT